MEGPLVKIDMIAEREIVTVNNGRPVSHRIPTETITPGDTLFYVLNVHNVGGGLAKNVVVDNPLPEGTVYTPGSATGKSDRILLSVDNGSSYIDEYHGLLPETVTHVRWEVDKMPAGSRRKLEFQVTVTMDRAQWLSRFYLWLASAFSK